MGSGTPVGSRTPLIMSAPPTAPPSPTLMTRALSEAAFEGTTAQQSSQLNIPASSSASSNSEPSVRSLRGRQSRATFEEDEEETQIGDNERVEGSQPRRPEEYSTLSRNSTGNTASSTFSMGHGRPPARPLVTTPLNDENSSRRNSNRSRPNSFSYSTQYPTHLAQSTSPPPLSPSVPSPPAAPRSQSSHARRQSHVPGPSSPVRPSLASPSIPQYPSSDGSTSRERGHHSARFSLASTVSHIIKDVGNEVKQAVRRSKSRSGRSMSRMGVRRDKASSSSRDRADRDVPERTVRGRNSQVMPLGDVQERSRSKSKSRFPDLNLDLNGGLECWKEFRSGTLPTPMKIS